MGKKKLIYLGSFFTYTIQGMIAISLGLLLPHMMDTYSINYSQGGTMIFFLLLGGVISSTLGGALVNKLGEKLLIILGAVCVALGYIVILFVDNIALIYFMLFIVGIGTGVFNIALNTLVADVSNSDPKKISTLHMFFAIGALLATLIAAAITYYSLPWKLFLYILIVMAAVTIIMFSRVSVDEHKQNNQKRNTDLSFFKKPYLYVFVALLFFYVGIENAVNGWVVTFLNESGIVSEFASNYILTVLWGLVIVGRIINLRLRNSITLESRIVVCAFVILLSYILLISTSSVIGLIVAVVVLGLAMSAFYPNVVANSSEKIKDNATALGLILSFGGLGGAVIPWFNGIVADNRGLQSGMFAVIISIGFLIIAAVINIVLDRKKL